MSDLKWRHFQGEDWPVRELSHQHDPAEIIEAIINGIEADNPPYLPNHTSRQR